MSLFYLFVESEHSKTLGRTIWLVIAECLFSAMLLVSEEFSVKAVEVRMGRATGRERLISSTGASTIH
jgi:hypothetical protein